MRRYYFSFFLLGSLILLTSCGGSKTTDNSVAEEVDYSALVKEQLPSVEAFADIVDIFQKGTSELLPTGQVWDNAEAAIKKEMGAKGFKVERDKKREFFLHPRIVSLRRQKKIMYTLILSFQIVQQM